MKKSPKSNEVTKTRSRVANDPASILQKHIPQSEVLEVWQKHQPDIRRRLFTPLLTLWTFISQVLSADKSLHAAVARTMASLNQSGKRGGSHDPSAYCKARYRIPVEVLTHLTMRVAAKLSELVPKKRCCGTNIRYSS